MTNEDQQIKQSAFTNHKMASQCSLLHQIKRTKVRFHMLFVNSLLLDEGPSAFVASDHAIVVSIPINVSLQIKGSFCR